jgi:hypothetical protein
MDYVQTYLIAEVTKLRRLSPVWNNRRKKKSLSASARELIALA